MKAKTFLFSLMTILCLSGISQTRIPINQLFINDATFNPFGSNQIFGLQISGSFSLNSDSSLVRILFVDDAYNEFLVYEIYAMISGSRQETITEVAEETKYLNSLTPNSLKIELVDATFFMDTIEIADQNVPDADSLMIVHLNDIQNQKIQSLNQEIQQRGMIWSAGITNISGLSYAKKKALFGDKFNLSGFEYYNYGFFEIPGGRTDYSNSSPYVKVWDWRSRHRANKSKMADGVTTNPYYDNDPNGSGWMTPPYNTPQN